MKYAPVLLYRTLGPTLPAGMEAAAAIWGICQLHVLNNRKTAARAGFDGLPPLAADRLFQAMLDNPSGVVFAETTYAESWQAVARPEQRINLHIPELLPELAKLAHSAPPHDPAYPFILAAGERAATPAIPPCATPAGTAAGATAPCASARRTPRRWAAPTVRCCAW